MPVEREEVIVTDRPAGGGISGVMLAVILIVLLLIVVGGITVFNGGFSIGGKPVTIDTPKITVTN
jgi:hypothetical protein